MSRIANKPVVVPAGVDVQLSPDNIIVKGKLGSLELNITKSVSVESVKLENEKSNVIKFKANSTLKHDRALAGTTRALVASMVQGVTEGFTIELELHGVGYRATLEGNTVVLVLGFSHDIKYPLPAGISCEMPPKMKVPTIVLKSCDKQRLGQVAAEIRSFRPPEPYKGKGVRIKDEYVRRKETKKK